MEKTILVLDAEPTECRNLCDLLAKECYTAIPVRSLADLKEYLLTESYIAVVIDIDSIHIDNRTIRKLVLDNPGMPILCMSKDKFHPELKDAICYHIYACLNKPVDPNELFYFLSSIYENEANDTEPSDT